MTQDLIPESFLKTCLKEKALLEGEWLEEGERINVGVYNKFNFTCAKLLA